VVLRSNYSSHKHHLTGHWGWFQGQYRQHLSQCPANVFSRAGNHGWTWHHETPWCNTPTANRAVLTISVVVCHINILDIISRRCHSWLLPLQVHSGANRLHSGQFWVRSTASVHHSLQSGWFWVRSTASAHDSLLDLRSFCTIFIHNLPPHNHCVM